MRVEDPVFESSAEAPRRGSKRLGRVRLVQGIIGVSALAGGIILLISLPPTSHRDIRPLQTPPPSTWSTFVGAPEDQFSLKHPPAWNVVREGGQYERKVYEVLPPDSVTAPGGSFVLRITVPVEGLDPAMPHALPDGTHTRADARPYIRLESAISGGPQEVTYRISWMPPCAYKNPGCAIGQTTLVASIIASDPAAWNAHLSTAEQIVASIEYIARDPDQQN